MKEPKEFVLPFSKIRIGELYHHHTISKLLSFKKINKSESVCIVGDGKYYFDDITYKVNAQSKMFVYRMRTVK